ncbi:MAG: RNA polymerase sigma factor [Bacteroidetes bacterium]|nr:RNA polymerase sigma factor [Bacteroidota bacterium]
MTDSELIVGCLDGSRRHQKALYDRYSPYMMGVCMRYASSQAEAEDLLQDGFVTVFRKLGSFEGRGELGAWMRRIFLNTALMNFRKQKHIQQQMELDAVKQVADAGEDPFSAVSAAELMGMMQLLPAGARMVFNLYAVEGFEHHEIAEQLGISVGTSKSQYSRARSLLKERLEKEERRVRGTTF